MRIIAEKTLREYITQHPNSESGLKQWIKITKTQTWQNFSQVKASINSVDMVGRAVVFNISGNNYRLITSIHYNRQVIYTLEVMTHAEYSKETWKTRYQVHSS